MTHKDKKSKGRSPLPTASPARRTAGPRAGGRRGKDSEETSEGDVAQARGPKKADQKVSSQKAGARRGSGARPQSAPVTRRPPGEVRSRPIERAAPTLATFPRRRPASEASEAGASNPSAPELDEAGKTELIAETAPLSEAPPSSEDVELPVDSTSEDIGMLGIGSRVYPPNMDFELFGEEYSDEPPPVPMDDPSVEARIRDIEARLDGLMGGVDVAQTVTPLGQAVPQAQADEAVDAARELLESDYYRRKWGRGALRQHEGGVDDFGLDPDTVARLRPVLEFLFKRYFRVEVEGIENIPSRGRAVVVANHSGALPFDGAMLREAVRLHHSKSRDLRWLAEDFSFYLPFIGVTMNRIGAVRACQENATRLLLTDHVVGVFPEGAEGIKKLYKDRYKLQRFGRGGFVRLCLKTKSPIVPCAIVGAEETNPILYRFDNLSKLLGLDYLPVTPTFPLLGPLGLLPAPTKWRMLFGEPISVEEYGPSAADDHVLVGRLSERVRASINGLLETGLRRRRGIWL